MSKLTNNDIHIGSFVKKKSGKKFQNGEKIALIEGFATMTIPVQRNIQVGELPTKVCDAVALQNCRGYVRTDTLECVEM